MKEVLKSYRAKNLGQLIEEGRKESLSLSKNWISLSLGQEKKTHFQRAARKKIAQLKTLIRQKEFLERSEL